MVSGSPVDSKPMTNTPLKKTYALGLEYNGRAFCGWQVQPDQPTVQAGLERALSAFLDEPVATFCAGRTDTGVHATSQVVSIETAAVRSPQSWVRGVNAHLPEGIAVRWALEVPEGFNARFSARSRIYEYWLNNDPVRSPLLTGRTGWCFRTLDVELMRGASRVLLGTHDFTSFRASQCQAATPVRTIERIEFTERMGLIGIRFQANAFLHHMIRNIVGSLVYVGTGRESPEWLARVLEARNRSVAAPTYSPDGLYFTGVAYPEIPGSGRSRSPFGWEDPAPADAI